MPPLLALPSTRVNFAGMGVFEFIVILVLISTLGKVAIAVGGPLAGHVGDLLKEMAEDRRAGRETVGPGGNVGVDTVEELEGRLARIEDRLDFIEALKAPSRPPALPPSGTPDVSRSDSAGETR